MDLRVLAAAFGIILVDLALSGDNALVIGAVAAHLPRRQQLAAIIYGGVGALVIRFALAAVATELLQVEYLRAAGAVVILVIAIRLLLPDNDGSRRNRNAPDRLLAAIVTITLADVAMSTDNVLAVGALAAGNVVLLAGGLTISVALLFVASALVALLVEKLSWIMDLAALILGWTAASLFVGDAFVERQLRLTGNEQTLVYLGCVGVVLASDLLIRWVVRRRKRARGGARANGAQQPATTDGGGANGVGEDSPSRTPASSAPHAGRHASQD